MRMKLPQELWVVTLSVMKQTVIQISKEVAWAPLGVFIAHAILGRLLGHEPYVDPAMHFLGGAAIAYFIRRAAELIPQWVGTPSSLGFDLIAFGLACFAALFWEFAELFSDIFLDTRIQISARNTLRDLALGVMGATTYLALRFISSKGSKATP